MFKTGDSVTIVKNTSGHFFPIGEICTVSARRSDGSLVLSNKRASWVVSTGDVKSNKTIKQPTMSNTKVDKTRRSLILSTAQDLLKANNTCTTLEIKTELRKTEPTYYWTQSVVSQCMDDFSKQGAFTYKDNGTFRTYSDPTKKVRATVKTSKPTKVAKKSVAKKTLAPTTGTISRSTAVKYILASGGRFFTVVFIAKDGSERTMNCQLLANQGTPALGYIKVKEAGKMRTNPADCIRNVNTQTLKRYNTFKVR